MSPSPIPAPAAAARVTEQPPLRLPFFYGWVIVANAVLSGFLASGMTNLVMGVLLKPMTEDLGWTRTMAGWAISAGTVVGGVSAPFIGKMADRYGARMLVPPAAAIVAVMFLAISQVSSYPLFMAAYIPGRAIAVTVLVGVVPLTAVANWFSFRRPRAMGIVQMALALGGSVMALLAQYLVETAGWRTVPVVFAVLTLIFVVVPGAVLLRRQPEDLGMRPDGFSEAQVAEMMAKASKKKGDAAVSDHSWTLAEAMRTPALWLIVFSFGIATFANGSIGFHQVAYYTDQGLAPAVAAGALSVYAFSGAVANVLWGFLTERFSERLLNVAALILSAACVWWLTTISTPLPAYIFSILFGLFARGESSLINIILAAYFGRKHFGSISGFTVPFQMAGIGIGPLAAAITYDATGSYIGVFYVFIGTYLFSAFLMFLARRPKLPAIRQTAAV
ncbi:MAG: MFS transporter [Chloroflexi bacterium]|nr:MFS transporter [Chloroflexota bacterium]